LSFSYFSLSQKNFLKVEKKPKKKPKKEDDDEKELEELASWRLDPLHNIM